MKTRVGIIFDDGFARSTIRTAEIFESYKLSATFAVLADPSDFTPGCGDFRLWNELQDRGHHIQPHGLTHANLAQIPFEQAVADIERCFQLFHEQLRGFNKAAAVYCFAYNASTPRLVDWLKRRVHAIRNEGSGFLSQADLESRVWPSATFGPTDPGDDLMNKFALCRQTKPAALLYCLHGLDGENWGAIAEANLRKALDYIAESEELEFWTPVN